MKQHWRHRVRNGAEGETVAEYGLLLALVVVVVLAVLVTIGDQAVSVFTEVANALGS